MQKLIILAALAAYCLAAPTHNEELAVNNNVPALQRPSPINPNIASDPKPAEHVELITDAKEIAKHKRESGKPSEAPVPRVLPTVQPNEQNKQQSKTDQHQLQKRDIKSDTKPVAAVTPKQNDAKPSPQVKPKQPAVPPKYVAQSNHKAAPAAPIKSAPASKQPTSPPTPANAPKQLQKRDDKTRANAASQPTTLHATEHTNSKPAVITAVPKDAPAVHARSKRDIPVPSASKHEDSDESSESDEDEEDNKKPEKHDNGKLPEKTEEQEKHQTTTRHPALRDHPVPVAELFARAKKDEDLEKTNDESETKTEGKTK